MRTSLEAVVVGAGIGGLTTAIALRRIGWSVTVLERAPIIAEVGAGLTLWRWHYAGTTLLGGGGWGRWGRRWGGVRIRGWWRLWGWRLWRGWGRRGGGGG